jgi:hypothetical protein
MTPIRKLLRLSAADRTLLLRTTLWLCATRVGLWLLPVRVVRRWLARLARSPRRPPDASPSRERIVWAVSVARRVVPRATCLPQALVGESLLARGGYPADLRIGVKKTGAGRLVGHAWVESEGRIVIGDLRELSAYTRLPSLPSGAASGAQERLPRA